MTELTALVRVTVILDTAARGAAAVSNEPYTNAS